MSNTVQIDAGEFRKALGSFTTGVTVVTSRGTDGNDVGLTANSFNSVSLDPPMVLWSLGKSARSMPHFRAAEYFAVHILSQEQEELSGRFARRGADKFSGLTLARGPDDIPLLQDCAARFTCRTAYQYEGGDHLIFVGEVIDFAHWDRLPLLFHGGEYGQIAKAEAAALEKGDGFNEASLGYLLRLATHRLLRPLKDKLAGRGLSVPQYYTLASLAKYGARSRRDLLALLELGDSVPDGEELMELETRGLIEEIDGRIHLAPAGSRLHMELVAFYKASESAALNALDYEMRQTLNLALLTLVESPDI